MASQPLRFLDRKDAGMRLAKVLARYGSGEAVIYALPRGGVVVAEEVARQLGLPLSLIIPRKIGHPENEEYAVCAVTEEGELVCNEGEASRLDPAWLEAARQEAWKEAGRRRSSYEEQERLPASGKAAIIIDDGIATGLTMRAAIRSLRGESPSMVVVAAPVAPRKAVEYLKEDADDVVVLDGAEPFLGAVGAYYGSFPQVSDEEVIKAMRRQKGEAS